MMRALFTLTVLVGCLVVMPAQAGDIIDRIVATVNNHPILQSDWEEAISYESFIEGRPIEKLTAEDRKAALDRLIDQELLREQLQAAPVPQAKPGDVKAKIEEVRKLYPGADQEAGWQATLSRYGLKQAELENRIANDLQLARFVDARLRPGIEIDSHSIEVYYRDTLLPKLRSSGEKQIALADVSPKIKEVLTQKKLNDLLAAWLQNLRSESQIHALTDQAPATGGQAR
ncbi:MAG TPA: SurA N-terminal domain-containing protein [Terriglobales bacterium]|nr:SurA N-terminal domain-containing protein [Terriglobales bacterium]